jgi:hypothetical protein
MAVKTPMGRHQTEARRSVTILQLQQGYNTLLQRVEELEEANANLAFEVKDGNVRTAHFKGLCMGLFYCSILFCLATIVVLGIILYAPGSIYTFAVLGVVLGILFLGALVILYEML